MADFIVYGSARDGNEVDPKTALLTSHFNPHRTEIEPALLVSNNSHVTAFVLVENEEHGDCFDALEDSLIRKAAHRMRRAARPPSPEPTRIIYNWRMVPTPPTSPGIRDPPPEFFLESTKIECSSPRHVETPAFDLPEGYDCGLGGAYSDAKTAATSGSADYIMQKHGNKFGTPSPARRASEVDGKPPRDERTSNDSVMVDFIS